ncbi:MAG: deoxynucleoside kinase [Rhabdochlamydiaceae bacterium]
MIGLNKFFIAYVCIAIFIMRSCLATHKIAIEGMPGAGKSTSLLDLISEFSDRCILFSETNPEPNSDWQDLSANDQGDIFHRIWTTRMHLVDALSEKMPCLLFDRSYYSNLAYKYASDRHCGTNFYNEYIEIFNKDLRDKQFSLIILLDVTPEIGLLRRYRVRDTIIFPWAEIDFLKEFREFYTKELIKFVVCPIVTINTDDLSPSEVKSRIREEIQKVIGIPLKHHVVKFSEDIKKQLLEFGQEKKLGKCHSELINVLGYPTIYFRQHSVQLYNGRPTFLNNQRWKESIYEITAPGSL